MHAVPYLKKNMNKKQTEIKHLLKLQPLCRQNIFFKDGFFIFVF